MKFRGPFFFSILLAAFLVAAYYPKIDNAEKEAVLMHTILNGLNQLHFSPKSLDDDFSERLYDLYLERIDGGRRFFTQEDIQKLEGYKDQLDDEALVGSYTFFDLSVDLLTESLKKTQTYYREILESPFDFDKNEMVELDGDKKNFAKNDTELREYWRKYLKYETLTRLNDKLEKQKDIGEEGEKKSYDELEAEAREDVLEVFDGWFDRMNKLKRENRLSFYLNSMTNVFDPHTGYYEPIEKQNFNIRMSGRLEGIGARLQTDGDYTKVVNIVVGGPAWKGKELEENDLIMKVAQEDEEPVDITGMQINDVVQLVRGDKGTTVNLTIKKVDGTVKDISIVRDVVVLEEGFAKSLILDGKEEGEKVGYIYLPRFYADFEDRNGRFCSTDVEKELEKLKAENVDGIILDLRNNGGGSLRDVVKMSGYFIEEGPIVQVKSRESRPEVLPDVDSRVQYDGPLIVMVNSFSASASEILAAALQDYGRAVIVGSQSTFGKGTVQRFFDLDRAIRGFSELKPLGEIKLTTQKFYRINGGSTQLKGVTPDIVLPDNYHFIKVGEKEHEYPMEWTKIDPVDYSQSVVQLDNLDKLRKNSEQRIGDNPTFQKIYENAQRLKEQRDMTAYPIGLEAFQNFEKEQEERANQYKDMFDEIVIEGVKNLEVDLPSIHADESKEARNEDWIKSVSKDLYIKETINIMHDMLSLK
jgi:carboxyl-terminal processing protease